MKNKQCQKLDTKQKGNIKFLGNKKLNNSNTCVVKSFSNIEINTKTNALKILQKGAQYIESYNSITKKPSNNFGDADTYFRKTLRTYEDFDFWKKLYLNFGSAKVVSVKPSGADNKRKKQEKREIIHAYSEEQPLKNFIAMMDDEEETETNTGEEDEEMKEVDDMIVRASRELEKVAEENQQLLEILDKPGCLLKESRNDAQIANEGGEDFVDNNVIKQLEEAERQAKDTANVIYELKTRVGELLKKEELTEEETKELGYKNKKLKEQMILFEGRTKKIQYLIEKTNILNTKPTKNSNDISQKVLLDKKGDDSVKSGVCSCCGENIRSSLTNIPSFAKKLSESYTMQEKLASENADLESVRFKLQEELLNKDRTLECLQRELGNLQNEMRLVSRENNVLNDKLKKLQRKEIGQNVKQQKSLDTAVVSTKLQEYSDNTYQLEKQLTDMENDVKCLHEEICAVQQEREHLEQHRKMMCMSRPCITPYLMSPLNTSRHMCVAPFSTSTTLSKGLSGQVLKELSEQYDKLESDLTSKLNETITLKTDYEKLKNLTKEAEQFKRITEDKIKECEKTMNGLKCQNKVPVEQEAQLDSAKKRFGKAQDALREQQLMIKYQKKHLEDVKNKYMEAQHQLEEQKRKINSKIDSIGGGALSLGAQIVTSLQDKLDEVKI